MTPITVIAYNKPMARWVCETCGATGLEWDTTQHGEAIARAGASTHAVHCTGKDTP